MLDWNQLETTCGSCRSCGLAEGRNNVVFGCGSRNADLMFIGEGPGEREDQLGIPFVGRAGSLLDDLMLSVGISRDEVYIANIVKCRPPQNRDPLPEEQQACIGYLRNQVFLIRPKIIVCLGRIAAGVIIREDFKITREHGQFIERNGVRLVAVYHPAALLRDPRKRVEAFDDFKLIKKELDSISAPAKE